MKCMVNRLLRAFSIVLLLSAQFFCGGCATAVRLECAALVVIPGTERVMKSPGFWISLHRSPDEVILDARGIERLNKTIRDEHGLTRDLAALPAAVSFEKLREELADSLNAMRGSRLYDRSGRPVPESFYQALRMNMDFDTAPVSARTRYGFIFRCADQRLLPCDDILTVKPLDIEFDELQNTSLDIGTPVAVVHGSKDGRWLYLRARDASGWVKKECVVFCGADDFKGFAEAYPFCVVTGSKADIFWDPQLRAYYDYVRMGARFSLRGSDASTVQIVVPFPSESGAFTSRIAYLRREDVQIGYLEYTPRAIINQAFKLLNTPYGWGGAGGEQDCSAFLQEIFATVGIALPRNSSAQGAAGEPLGRFDAKTARKDKLDVLSKAVAGKTIIQLNGHVLLYLGMYNGRPYAIHQTYGYGEKTAAGLRTRVVNRAVVTGLFLGEGSAKGSLFDRIVQIRAVE